MINSKLQTTLTLQETKITHRHEKFSFLIYSAMFLILSMMTMFLYKGSWFDSGYDSGSIVQKTLAGINLSISIMYLLGFFKCLSKKNLRLRMEFSLMNHWFKKPNVMWGSYKNMFAWAVLTPFATVSIVWFINGLQYGITIPNWHQYLVICINFVIFISVYIIDNSYWKMFISKLRIYHGNVQINNMLKERQMEDDFKRNQSLWTIFGKKFSRDWFFWFNFFACVLLLTPLYWRWAKKVINKYTNVVATRNISQQ